MGSHMSCLIHQGLPPLHGQEIRVQGQYKGHVFILVPPPAQAAEKKWFLLGRVSEEAFPNLA